MKKKSRNSRQRMRPIAPLVRGPLKTKEKGELAELAFLHKAASLGFGVAKPYGDNERYDFILDSGERFWRVQVRSTYGRWGRGQNGFGIPSTSGTKRNAKPFRDTEIDFFVAYIVPADVWYVIPVNQIAPFRCLSFYPYGCRIGGFFESYREAWHLMAPGADLSPQ